MTRSLLPIPFCGRVALNHAGSPSAPLWPDADVPGLQRARRGGRGRGSDADQLAGLTRVPAVVWVGVLFVLDVAALLAGAWLIWPGLPG